MLDVAIIGCGVIGAASAYELSHYRLQTVRGSVMNPNDHPHGGGEGKAPVGRP